MPVLAGEGVPVDLAPGEPGEAESRAETGQGGAFGLLAGQQQGRVGLADQLRQLAGSGQQRGAVRATAAASMSQASSTSGRTFSGHRLASTAASVVCSISARSCSQRLGASARNSGIRFWLARTLRSIATVAGTISRVAFQRGSRGRGISSTGGSLPRTGPKSAANRRGEMPTRASSEIDMLTFA